MKRKKRNWVMILVVVGLLLLLSRWVSFLTFAALLFIFWGVQRIRENDSKRGYVLVLVGSIIFVMENFIFLVGIVLIAIGLFYLKSHHVHTDSFVLQKRNLFTTLRHNLEPWVLQDIRLMNVIGDIDLDFSLAIPEQHETIVVLEGVLGDVDLFIPEEMGVLVEAEVLMGQIRINGEAETGVWQKIVWQSPHYQHKEYKVKLMISYIVGDIVVHSV